MPRPGLILFVTHGADDHIPLVARELESRGAEFVRFDTETYPGESAIELGLEEGNPRVLLRLGGREVEGDNVAAVLHRHLRLPAAQGALEPDARRLAESELRAALEGGLFALQCLWMNHPHANRLSRSKPVQLALAARHGFTMPETRITRDPEEIRELYGAWDGAMVAKLVGGQITAPTVDDQYVVHTTLLREEDLLDDRALAACPAIYQRYVDKAYELRVTVVGDQVFATRIDSQDHESARVDWRRAGPEALRHEPHRLAPEIADRCRTLLRLLRLEIAGIDLIVTPDGDTVFLEINAAGQWAWIERMTGQPIAAAIADRLIAGRSDGHAGPPW